MALKNASSETIKLTHSGEMLREDFMSDYRLTVTELAANLGVSRQTIKRLGITIAAASPTVISSF